MASAKEIGGNMSDNREDSVEDPMMRLEALKAEKRKLKAAITRQLNKLVGRVAGVSGGIELRSLEEIKGIKATLDVWKQLNISDFAYCYGLIFLRQ